MYQPIKDLGDYYANLSRNWSEIKHNNCLTFVENNNDKSFNYEQYFAFIAALVDYFQKSLGISKRDSIALLLTNQSYTPAVLMALLAIGCDVVPLNPADEEKNWLFIINDAEVGSIFIDDCPCGFGKNILPKVESLHHVYDVSAVISEVYSLSSIPTIEQLADFQARNSADSNLIMYTSGTTGRPKGAILSQFAVVQNALSLVNHFQLSKVTHMCTLPLHHAHGFALGFLSTFLSYGHLVLTDGLEIASWYKSINKYGVEFSSTVPQQLKLLNKLVSKHNKINTLKRMVVSSKPIDQELSNEFEDKTGIKVYTGWGLCEYAGFVTCVNTRELCRREAVYGGTWPSIGAPLANVEVRVGTIDNGKIVEAGPETVAEYFVKGPCLFKGYMHKQPNDKSSIIDGFLRTGDMGFYQWINGKKCHFITGRKSEFIKRLRFKVNPLYVEQLIYDNLDDNQVELAVVGFEHSFFGQEIGMYVHSKTADLDLHLWVSVLQANISERYLPKVIVVGNEPLGRTATGKIQRYKLLPLFADFINHRGGCLLVDKTVAKDSLAANG